MKLIIRLSILSVLLLATPREMSHVYAISGPKVDQQTAQTSKVGKAKKLRVKRKKRFWNGLPRKLNSKKFGPAEWFFGGLALAAFGALLVLTIPQSETADIGDIFVSIIQVLTGWLAIVMGGFFVMVGGLWWLLDRLG